MVVIDNWPLSGAGEHGAATSSHRHCPGSTSLGNWGHILLHTNLEVCASTWASQLLQFRCLQVKELAKLFVKKDSYLSDASTCYHEANSLSGWNSSPPCKWCGVHSAPSHASVTHYGPPNYCRIIGWTGLLKSCGYRKAQWGAMGHQATPVMTVRKSPLLNWGNTCRLRDSIIQRGLDTHLFELGPHHNYQGTRGV